VLIKCDATDEAFSVYLPDATVANASFLIIKTDSSTNAVTVYPYSSQTVDDADSLTISSQYDCHFLVPDGSNYKSTKHHQAESTIDFTDITTGNASTTAHGYAPKAVAPAAGTLNYLGINNGETVYACKSASSNPGAAAAILQTTPAGLLTLQNLTINNSMGIGISPDTISSLKIYKHSDNTGYEAISENVVIHTSEDGTHSAQIIYLDASTDVDNGKTNAGNVTAFYNLALKTGLGTLSGQLNAAWLRYGMTGGIVGTLVGLYIDPQFGSSGSATNSIDIYLYGRTGSVTPTNEWCINSLHDVPSWFIGNIGIGGAAQFKADVPLHLYNESAGAGVIRTLKLSGGNTTNGDGVGIMFNPCYGGALFNTNWVGSEIASITPSMASYANDFVFNLNTGVNATTLAERMRIVGSTGNVGFGTNVFQAAAVNCLAIANGTAPAAGTANQAYLYTLAGELWAMDSAGNATQQTPHNKDGEWEYFSKNVITGKIVKINMEKFFRYFDNKFKTKFLEESYGN
jgi:hypothetical protein